MTQLNFCDLQKDQKTFDYIKKYVNYIDKNEDKLLFELENEIQNDEIEKHLANLNISVDDKYKRNIEAIKWIKLNAEGFRLYLDTIKAVAKLYLLLLNSVSLVFYCKELDCCLEDKINNFNYELFVKVIDIFYILKDNVNCFNY